MAPRLTFRPAAEDDLERVLEIYGSAFPDPRPRDVRLRYLRSNVFGTFEDLWVATDGAVVFAHAFLFPLASWFGEALVDVGGIASVGVAPEARGRGVGSAIIAHLHEVARARGDAVTVLYPFRQGFYARLGYGPTAAYRRLHLAPAAIPWRVELSVRPAIGADRGEMGACWEAVARRRTGSLVRSDRAWEGRFLDERRVWYVVEGRSGIEGYVSWIASQSEAHAAISLEVRELVARTSEAERSLWALLGAQRDQVALVSVNLPADDGVEGAFVDMDRHRPGRPDVEHCVGEVAIGPMVRLVEVARALSSRGYREEGRIVLEADGARLEVSSRQGRATVAPSSAAPELSMSAASLAAIAFGGLRPSDAVRFGWVRVRDDRTVALADALFSLPPYFSPDAF